MMIGEREGEKVTRSIAGGCVFRATGLQGRPISLKGWKIGGGRNFI